MKPERFHVAYLVSGYYSTREEMLTLLQALGFCPDQDNTVSRAALDAVHLINNLSELVSVAEEDDSHDC